MKSFTIALALLAPVVACSQQPANRSARSVLSTALRQRSNPSQTYALSVVNDLFASNDKKVSLTLNDASPKDAIKRLFEAAGEDYVLADTDLKGSPITLSVKDVRFTTALDLITQAAGVKYAMEMKDGKKVYRIGKNVQSGYSIAYSNSTKPLVFTSPEWHGNLNWVAPKTLTSPDGLTRLYSGFTTEERSTFTCPHCKGQATVLRHRQQAKCPKCGKTFAGDWQYCPNDGTKRPAVTGTWKYCPICGKEVKMESSTRNVEPTVEVLSAVGTTEPPREP